MTHLLEIGRYIVEVSVGARITARIGNRVVLDAPNHAFPPEESHILSQVESLLRSLLIKPRPASNADLAWAMKRRILRRVTPSFQGEDLIIIWGRGFRKEGIAQMPLTSLFALAKGIERPQPHPHLLGVKSFLLVKGVLTSPIRGTPWTTPILQAHSLSTSQLVEGEAGIHALHAPNLPLEQALEVGRYLLEVVSFLSGVVGLVRPYGKVVVGPRGWRSEFAQIVALMATNQKVAEALASHYNVPCYQKPYL